VKVYDIQEMTKGKTMKVIMVSDTEESIGFISDTR